MSYKNVDRKMPAKGLVTIGVVGILASLWVPTYWVASRLNFADVLGPMVPGWPVYYPGQAIDWAMTWGPSYPKTFIPALAVMMVGVFLSGLLIKSSKDE